MKQNMFGERILQPGDDIGDSFVEVHATFDSTITAQFISDDSAAGLGWTAILVDEEGNEIQIHDFRTYEELVTGLTEQGVEIDE